MADANPITANPHEEPEPTKKHGKVRGVRVSGKDTGTKPSPETAARPQNRPLHRAAKALESASQEPKTEVSR